MELGGRKILPRPEPSGGAFDGAIDKQKQVFTTNINTSVARAHSGDDVSSLSRPRSASRYAVWTPASMEDDALPKRSRSSVDDRILPGLNEILSPPPAPQAQSGAPISLRSYASSPSSRLTGNEGHPQNQHGEAASICIAPSIEGAFSACLTSDSRDLSLVMVERQLADTFSQAWTLRHYIRRRMSTGSQIWWDHVMLNDAAAIGARLRNWTCVHDPGSPQYPASQLYKSCLWLYFNRTIQNSHASSAFRQMVDDGLHFYRALQNTHDLSSRHVLLVPLFLLGIAAFVREQRVQIDGAIRQISTANFTASVNVALTLLNEVWEMMDAGRDSDTWNWERLQPQEQSSPVEDQLLLELLKDPLTIAPRAVQPSNISTTRLEPIALQSAVSQIATPASALAFRAYPSASSQDEDHWRSHRRDSQPSQTSRNISYSPQQSMRLREPALPHQRQPSAIPGIPRQERRDTSDDMQSDSGTFRGPQRKKPKRETSIPPCPQCGKVLKNSSDAQKHRLQHEKPFRCREPGCTRTEGFATENDLQRHRASVHRAVPLVGRRSGYVCAACPGPSQGTPKWWPRLDNFKAHIRRKHADWDVTALIINSEQERRPEDLLYESGCTSPPGAEEMEPMTYHQNYHHLHHDHHNQPSGSTTPSAAAAATAAAAIAMAAEQTSPSQEEEDEETNPSTLDTDGMDLEMDTEQSPPAQLVAPPPPPPPPHPYSEASPEEIHIDPTVDTNGKEQTE